MIDEKKLIKHRDFLKDLQTSEQFYDDKESRQIIGELIALIDDGFNSQPKADWIPCRERLPDKNQRCLICYENPLCKKSYIDVDRFDGKHFDFFGINRVMAWQPLPNPYQDHLGEVNGMVEGGAE